MKKLWWLGLALLLAAAVAAGCSNDEGKSTDKKDNKDTEQKAASDSKENVQSDLIDFYMNLTSTINNADSDLNAYEAALGQDEPPAKDELMQMQQKAADSADAVVSGLGDVKVPDSLKDYKSDLDAAMTDLTDAYKMKAEELKKDTQANLDAANEKMASADEKLASILEKAGLTKASITSDTN
ncbi:hypothetical protein [Falsibacillus albus]|uniref:Lipoprotein n=1 Tax=Falsibacillus albus TaxID=2478915 RepID=A0A3L7JLA9_9BACI|nr:hypothetical protein [Falsibacillus albus]RLQ91608.1 hypothetical protein D9X91_20605 [Falsibacillus albus]